jgi:hypothetical protein
MSGDVGWLVDLLKQADVEDGWKVRTRTAVAALEDRLGAPLGARAASQLTLAGSHDHEQRPLANAQFLFQERFELPQDLYPQIRIALTKRAPDESEKLLETRYAYIALTVSHRFRAKAHPGMAAHVRVGFAVEADRSRCERARGALNGKIIQDRLAEAGAPAGIDVQPIRPVPGLRLETQELCRVLFADDIARFGSTDELVDAAVRDLVAVQRAISR